MKKVATIEINSETGERINVYTQREAHEGHWVWMVYTHEDGEWVEHTGPNKSRDAALDAIQYVWGSYEWDLLFEDAQ